MLYICIIILAGRAHVTRNRRPFVVLTDRYGEFILRALIENPGLSQKEMIMRLGTQPDKIEENFKKLRDEGFLKTKKKRYNIA